MRWLQPNTLSLLDLDYQREKDRSRAAAWLLLIIAVCYSGDVAWSYFEVSRDLKHLEREKAALSTRVVTPAATRVKAYVPKDAEHELVFAQSVIQKIAFPWNQLFDALNSSKVDGAELLSIDPDTDAKAMQITAEAKDFPTLLTYLSQLKASRRFRTVSLTQHEIKSNEPRQPILFTVMAVWDPR